MTPSLAFLELASGRLAGEIRLAARLHQLSIRHVAVNARGPGRARDAVRGQQARQVPLVGLHDGGGIRLLEAPAAIERRMRHYTGAIAFDASGGLLAVSSPRGNLFTFWAAGTGKLVDQVELADGCGVTAAAAPGVFVVSDGRGEVLRVEPRAGSRRQWPSPTDWSLPGTTIWLRRCGTDGELASSQYRINN